MAFTISSSLDFSEAYRSEMFTDLDIIGDGGDGQPLRVHKVIISAALKNLKDEILGLGEERVIKVKHPHVVIKALVELLYCGESQIPSKELEAFKEASSALGLSGFNDDSSEDTVKVDFNNAGKGKKLFNLVKRKRSYEEESQGQSEPKPGPPKNPKVEPKPIEIPKFSTLEDGRVRCMRCESAVFNQLGSARRHFNEQHVENTGKPAACPQCSKIFKSERVMKEHLRVKHKISSKLLKSGIN